MDSLMEIRMRLDEFRKQMEETEKDAVQAVCRQFNASLWQEIKQDEVLAFVKKPYAIVPYKQGEWRLFIPRFIPLEVGWLEFQTDSYNVFRVNRYVDWLTPLPEVLKDELGIELPEFKVALDLEHNIAVLEEGDAKRFKKKYQLFFGQQLGEKSFQIKSPKKFSLVIELLKDGVMPFRPAPVNSDDILKEDRVKFELRDYQKEAWMLFLKYSHVGIFYPWGAGKSMLGLYAIGKIRGEKLVVVPTVTLREQWEERIENQLDVEPNEVKIVTYHSAVKEPAEKQYTLIVFDEVHHLPSNVFSVISFLKRKYTIGLSGCVSKGTKILCDDSWKSIEHLCNEEKLFSYNNGDLKKTEIRDVWKSDWRNKKPYMIETLSGRKIKLTNDHPVLTIEGWKRAEEIKNGDIVICYNELPSEESPISLPIESVESKSKSRIDFDKIKSKGRTLAQILGFAMGDSILDEKYRLTFTISSNEIESITKVLNEFGINATHPYKKKNRDPYSIRVRSSTFGRFINFLGLPVGNKRVIKLEVPKWIYDFNLEREFLSGLWGSEGTPSKLRTKKNKYKSSTFLEQPRLSLNTKNARLLRGFFEELVRLHKKIGIKARYNVTNTKENSKKFELRVISGLDNIIKFSHLIQFAFSPDKQDRSNAVLNYYLLKKKLLTEREEKIRINDQEIPSSTRSSWKRNERKFVELRNGDIKLPILSNKFRLELVSSSSYLSKNFEIFNLRVPETENFIANGFIVHNSPYREDGRSELIFGLTGYPIGVSWGYFFKKGLVRKPKVNLIIIRDENEKLAQLDRLMVEPKATLVYCDDLAKGETIAKRFNGTFIKGGTKNRLETVRSALDKDGFVILSRVGDEGISLPEIQRVIEHCFLFGSRRQEAQRAGRLFHAIEEGEHIILMTLEEYRKYKKRLYSLIEKGIEIKIENLAYELTD